MAGIRLFYLIADGFPTHRPDLTVLFGRELPRYGIYCDLVSQRTVEANRLEDGWSAGRALLGPPGRGRISAQLYALWHDIWCLLNVRSDAYDAIQVRDKVFAGLLALLVARVQGIPFFYWMSFPMSEGFIALARERGLSLGLGRWLFVVLKGVLGRFVMYRLLLPASDHVFVQSRHMAEWVAHKGVSPGRLTAVPMGVDMASLSDLSAQQRLSLARLQGHHVIVYQGTLDRVRRLDVLFEVLAHVRTEVPDALLLLIGDAADQADIAWLRGRAQELGVSNCVVWTGWVAQADAWDYVKQANVAVSLIPRGELFDFSSPTKVVEYMALGVPVVANDLPDQHEVLTESGAGLSVSGTASEVSKAIVTILLDSSLARRMSEAGPSYIRSRRSYDVLGRMVAEVYRKLLGRAERISVTDAT